MSSMALSQARTARPMAVTAAVLLVLFKAVAGNVFFVLPGAEEVAAPAAREGIERRVHRPDDDERGTEEHAVALEHARHHQRRDEHRDDCNEQRIADDLLLGGAEPYTGSASLGASVAIGVIDQARTGLAEDLPLGDAFEAAVPEMTQGEVRTLLAKFGLKADQVTSHVGRLSPGERTRAAMALLQARGVNLLVLDEPTNHLDLPAIEQLESALDAYDGTLLLVTHDRQLLEAVTLDRTIELGAASAAA